MGKERSYGHTIDLIRLYDHMERQGPQGLEMFGIARHFASLPKKVRTATIVQMDAEMQALSHHRGQPYAMPQKAYKRAVQNGILVRPEGKKQLKAWKKVRTRALHEIRMRHARNIPEREF